jgi:hypothetical protein
MLMGTNSDKRRRHQVGPKNSRRGLRPLLVFAALAALAVVLVPTGSAKPPTAPIKLYDVCLEGGTTPCTSWSSTGGSTSTISGANPQVTLNVQNESGSNTTLGSLNLDMPSGITLQVPVGAAGDPITGTSTITQLQLRNLNLAPGSSYHVTFTIAAPSVCGTVQWNSPAAKQSNDFNGSGNDYALTKTGGLTSLITNGCHLAWIHQPASAKQSTTITDTPFTSSGNDVAVAVENASNAVMTNLNTGTATATLALTTGSFDDCGAGCSPSFSYTPPTFTNGVATFTDFQSAYTGTGFTVTASALGLSTPASSPPFVIQTNGVDCLGQDPCLLNGGAGDVQVNASANGGNFLFIAVGPASAPGLVTTSGGCANFKWPFNDGFALTDGRTAQGTVDVTVSIPQKDLKQVYGPNYGQPNVPICAGAMRLVNNQPVSCTTDVTNGLGGWADRTLGSDGRFNGGYSTAVCDPTTGYWWGILGTFQDPNPPFNSNSIPLITGWGSSPDGVYRTFTIHEPSGWDGHYVP